MTDYPESLARGWVRGFSNSLKSKHSKDDQASSQQHILEETFIEQVECEDELTRLMHDIASNPKISGELREHFAQLKAVVEEFNERFPDIAKQNGSSKSLSWKSLQQNVLRLKNQHEAKSQGGFVGSSKKGFHGVCATINDHLSLLKILPQGEKFTAPICGSVEIIVKASVNHERVGVEFGAALKEIDMIVHSVKQELSLYHDTAMLGSSIELCCQIIEFVALPLRWYTQKRRNRMLVSFNDNLSEKYHERVKDIRLLSEHIKRGMRFHAAEHMANILPQMMNHIREHGLILQKITRWTEENSTRYEKAEEEQYRITEAHPDEQFGKMSLLMAKADNNMGAPMKQIIHREAQQIAAVMYDDPRPDPNHPGPRNPSAQCSSASPSQDIRAAGLTTRSQVSDAAKGLDSYLDFAQIDSEFPDENIFVEGEAARRLQTWTAQTSSSFLGIFGPSMPSYKDPARLLTSNYIRAAKTAGIPYVSYFCNIAHEPPPAGRLRETVGLVQLLYALLKQLVIYLPKELPPDSGLSRERFEALEGTLDTWPEALTLFDDLLALARPPYLLFAIHGLETLEHSATSWRLSALVDLLRRFVGNETGNGPKVKVLFTTSGLSQVLSEKLVEDEICDISYGNATRRPGKAGKGRKRMDGIEFGDASGIED